MLVWSPPVTGERSHGSLSLTRIMIFWSGLRLEDQPTVPRVVRQITLCAARNTNMEIYSRQQPQHITYIQPFVGSSVAEDEQTRFIYID